MEALARVIEEGGELPALPASEVRAVPAPHASTDRAVAVAAASTTAAAATAAPPQPCRAPILPSIAGWVPPLQWLREPEPAAEFKARIQGSIDYAQTPLKGSRHLEQQRQQQQRLTACGEGTGAPAEPQQPEHVAAAAEAAAAAAAQHTSSQFVASRAVAYSQEPALAAAYARGWEQARQWERQWESGEAERVGGQPLLLLSPALVLLWQPAACCLPCAGSGAVPTHTPLPWPSMRCVVCCAGRRSAGGNVWECARPSLAP